MRKTLFVILVLLSAIGCFESKEDYVLNPDGSGKVTIVGSFETTMPGMPPVTDPKEGIRHVKELLEKSKGVDAWSGVSYDRTKEGRVSFKGTAYFPDISKLDLETFGKEASLKKEGNKLVLLIEEEEEEETEATAARKPSAEEMKTQVEQAKKQWQTMKTMMGPMLEKIKQDLTYKLPGAVESSTNMKKIDASTVNILVDGANQASNHQLVRRIGARRPSAAVWTASRPFAGHLWRLDAGRADRRRRRAVSWRKTAREGRQKVESSSRTLTLTGQSCTFRI
ncbi:hypothetical protein L0152_04740 [bacterium]|nr:hypothetical protein [bacterium]